MIKQLILSSVALAILSGCMTPPAQTSSGAAAQSLFSWDILAAKVGFCTASLNPGYDEVTQFVGLERTMPPEERKAIKDATWQKWLNDVDNAKRETESKVFWLRRVVKFNKYDATQNRLELAANAPYYRKLDHGEIFYENALPTQLIFNKISNSEGIRIRPNKASGSWVFQQYANPTKSDKSIYVMNEYSIHHDLKLYSYDYGSYGGTRSHRGNDKSFGVHFDMQPWMSHAASPFKIEDGKTYFDITNINFLEAFGVYPETGEVAVYVEHFYELDGCEGLYPQAKVKEIVISAINPVKAVNNTKEIIRFVL